jgi:hypothetical protein
MPSAREPGTEVLAVQVPDRFPAGLLATAALVLEALS